MQIFYNSNIVSSIAVRFTAPDIIVRKHPIGFPIDRLLVAINQQSIEQNRKLVQFFVFNEKLCNILESAEHKPPHNIISRCTVRATSTHCLPATNTMPSVRSTIAFWKNLQKNEGSSMCIVVIIIISVGVGYRFTI